jgi:hypothetical protein
MIDVINFRRVVPPNFMVQTEINENRQPANDNIEFHILFVWRGGEGELTHQNQIKIIM